MYQRVAPTTLGLWRPMNRDMSQATEQTSEDSSMPPILRHKRYDAPSVFAPENLLREARRQTTIPAGAIPRICVLDPDGDIVRYLRVTDQASLNPHWACYHTELYDFTWDEIELGVVDCAVGAPFAVLVTEGMFTSGCELLISVTSSGQIMPVGHAPHFFVLIDKALRDEGASYHWPTAGYWPRTAPTVE